MGKARFRFAPSSSTRRECVLKSSTRTRSHGAVVNACTIREAYIRSSSSRAHQFRAGACKMNILWPDSDSEIDSDPFLKDQRESWIQAC